MAKTRRNAEPLPAKPRLKPLVAAIICAGYGTFAGLPGYAQDTADTGTESTVSSENIPVLRPVQVRGDVENPELASPKFTAPLLDTPQTVQIIPQEVFTQQGAQNLTDVLNNTPGISFNAGENGFATGTNNFSLRGFDTSGNIFIDGARDSGSYSRDVFNVEQVEVVKGPAADNGRGGAGGYINLVSKTPQLENFRTASVSYGFDNYDSDARQRAVADINQTIGDNAAFRVNLLVEESGVAGRELAERSARGFAPSLAFGLDSPTRFIFAYQHVEQNDLPDWGIPAHMIEGTFRYNSVAASADRDNFYGLESDYDDTTSDSLLFRIEHAFSDTLRLSNQTRQSDTEREARYTLPTGYTPATQLVATQIQFYDRDTSSLSNLTNLAVEFETGAVKHNLVAGLEISSEESDARRYGTPAGGNTNIFNPDPARAAGAPLNPIETNDVKVETQAIYVHDTLEFGEQWELTGGLRTEQYDVTIDSNTVAGAPTGTVDGFKESESTLGGKLGLVYKPAENGSLYIAVSRSTLPPGSFLSNSDISRTGDNAFPGLVPGAKVLESNNLEFGTKWNFYDGRLATALAFFNTEKRNVPITGREAGETVDTLKGYGKQIVEGAEFSISGSITDAWYMFGGFVKLSSERQHSAFLDEARCRSAAGDYQMGATPNSCPALVAGPVGTNGDELAFTPEESASFWTTYNFASGLMIGGGVQRVGDSWVGRPDDASRIIANGLSGELPGYTVTNLVASYELNDTATVRLNIDNVTDELYATSMNWSAQRVLLGPSRSFLLSADFQF